MLATGGGAVLLPREPPPLWRRAGSVVYLQTSVAQQVHRVRHGRHRPLLTEADPARGSGS